MIYVFPAIEIMLAIFCLWVARMYWTEFEGRFWRVMSWVMTASACGAVVAAAVMLTDASHGG